MVRLNFVSFFFFSLILSSWSDSRITVFYIRFGGSGRISTDTCLKVRKTAGEIFYQNNTRVYSGENGSRAGANEIRPTGGRDGSS